MEKRDCHLKNAFRGQMNWPYLLPHYQRLLTMITPLKLKTIVINSYTRYYRGNWKGITAEGTSRFLMYIVLSQYDRNNNCIND